MAQQVIGIGTVANDGTGDPLRTAFSKTKGNFSELYGEAHPGYIVANWYAPLGYTTTNTSAVSVANSIRLYPAFVAKQITIDTLGCRVIANAAGNVQLAIYANNATTMRPTGSALVSTASISTASAAAVSSAAALQFGPGMYWFAANTDTVSLTFTCQNATTSGIFATIIGSATQGNVFGSGSGSPTGLSTPVTFNTWGDLTAAVFTEIVGANYLVGVEFKVASVP